MGIETLEGKIKWTTPTPFMTDFDSEKNEGYFRIYLENEEPEDVSKSRMRFRRKEDTLSIVIFKHGKNTRLVNEY